MFLKAAEGRVARGRAAGLIEIYLSVALEERCAALLHDVFRKKAERSSPHCLHQRHDPEDLHRAFQVVGQDMQTHSDTEPLAFRTSLNLKTRTCDAVGERYCLSPGMQVSAEINWGTRTVVEYLLSPVRKAFQEAGRER